MLGSTKMDLFQIGFFLNICFSYAKKIHEKNESEIIVSLSFLT